MDYKLLVVTYSQDMAQFNMFCHCLAKNWQGPRHLIVVMGQATRSSAVQSVVEQQFDATWTVEIFPTVCTKLGGNDEQQVNKIVYSITSGADNVIVFDSKDFLLKPGNTDMFVKKGQHRYTYRLPGKLVHMGYDIGTLVDRPVDHLPAMSNLTPWVWNVVQLEQCWADLNRKFGWYDNWTSFHAQSEIYAYYVHVWTQDPTPIVFCQQRDSPLLFAGGWSTQTYHGMLQQAKDFDQQPTCVIWKHSRRLVDARCLDITKSVLKKYAISDEFVQQVYN